MLDLDPASKTYDSKSFPVSVATNNITGYKLSVSTTGDITDLTRDISSDTTTLPTYTIPTLDSGSSYAAPSDFPANKWGYKKDSGNYIPFSSPTPLLENTTATNGDTTTLSFASKIDYTLASGAYKTTLIFTATTNPMVNYIQDLNPALCTSTPMTVVDKRDNEEYTIAKLPDGNCWMTQNLRYQGDTVGSTSTATSWIMKSATSNISADKTMTMADLTAGNTYDAARYHIPTSAQIPSGLTADDIGVWYNYAAASAMTITGSSNENAQVYDICPKGWRLPTNFEQSGITSQASAYSPVAGGNYYGGTLYNTGYGYWWSSTSGSSTNRYYLRWVGSSLDTGSFYRDRGFYVRCILNDPRTISDITTMQEINSQIVANTAEGATATLKDVRDNNTYTVAKINGSVWMTQNLRYIGDTGSSSGSMVMKSTTSNISADTTITYSDIDGAADSYTNAMIHDSGNATNGVWYNYIAATATTITGASNNNAQVYDVCPASWKLPSSSEQSSVISYKTLFNPVPGGAYNNGTFNRPNNGYWFSSTSHTTYGSGRYILSYENDSLSFTYCTPYYVCGCNIRCIAK